MNRASTYALLLLAGTMVACGGDDSLIGERVPNSPPNTEVTATPPERAQTSFSVEFFWKGSDEDGEVTGFEWRMSDNGEDGVVDIGDTMGLPWTFTAATDSVFFVSADIDSFGIDVDDPNQNPATFRFWQTHTFFIRAVDDRGAVDPQPATVSFTATTIAPRVTISLPEPVATITCEDAPQVLTFGWDGVDPDVEGNLPVEVRYILKPIPGATCLTRLQYEQMSPLTANDPLWEDWIAYDAPEDAGVRITLDRQPVGNIYLFAVQVRDVAGAVTPTFQWGQNVRHIKISSGLFPVLTVEEQFLGTERFVSTNRVVAREVVSGQPISFSWGGSAEDYAGVVDAYRYGWNVVDPSDPNDPGWAVAWGNGPNWRQAATRTFSQGSPSFVVQCRDNSGTVSRGFYQFQVIQIADRANQRELLLVDDWALDNTGPSGALEAAWDREFDKILGGQIVGFQDSDILDVQDETARLRFALANEYKGIVWFQSPSTGSFFHSRLAPSSRLVPRFNWLEVYQAQVGNLFMMGPGAAWNSIERGGEAYTFPIIFDVPALPPNGMGVQERADGTEFNRGTLRWPYSAWCMESVDIARPADGRVFGEPPGQQLREMNCDGLFRAVVDTVNFLGTYPDATGVVRNMIPLIGRTNLLEGADFKLPFEEFYNSNVTTRDAQINLRTCQVPMYRYSARRDNGLGPADPLENCRPRNRTSSSLKDTVIGLASTRYAATKQLAGSEDFIWGFHPLAFETDEVKDAILWVLESRWELPVR